MNKNNPCPQHGVTHFQDNKHPGPKLGVLNVVHVGRWTSASEYGLDRARGIGGWSAGGHSMPEGLDKRTPMKRTTQRTHKAREILEGKWEEHLQADDEVAHTGIPRTQQG